MARPVVTDVAEQLYSAIQPLAYADEKYDWPLLKYCEALSHRMQEVEDVVRDDGDKPGWSSILDVDRAPYVGLPWLGQFVGLQTPDIQPGETQAAHDARVRDYIRAVGGFDRGTPGSIVASVQQYLTGTKSVILIERDTSPWHFKVMTRESETLLANVPLIEAAIKADKPAGLQFTYERIPDWTYDDLDALAASYDALDAMFSTYDAMEVAP